MRSMMIFTLVSTITLSSSLFSRAADIVNHASAKVIVADADPSFNHIVHGFNQAQIDPVYGSFPGYQPDSIDSMAFASVTSNSATLMSLYAYGSNTTGGGFTPMSEAFASGVWRDVIYLEPGLSPDKIQLHFSFSGSFSLIRYEDPWGLKYGSVGFRAFVYEGILSESYLDGPWDDQSPPPPLTVDIPYNATYGGYAWTLTASAQVHGLWRGVGEADFSHTVGLGSVTLLDGTEITNDQMRFDSGLQIQPVPEPSTYALGIIATGVMGIVARRRKARRA